MRSKLQLTTLLLLMVGCRRERAVDFTVVEDRMRLTIGDCPPVVLETKDPSGRARFDPASGLIVETSSLQLRGLEPSMAAHPPPEFAFVATVDRAAPRDCHDAGYEVPATFFRAAPVSVAQLQAGRFELRSTGSAPIAGELGQLSWEWSVRFESASPTQVAPPRLETWDRCLAEVKDRRGFASARMGTIPLGDAGCEWLTAVSDGGARVASRHKIFGTRFLFDAKSGTTTAPEVRVIGEQLVSMPGSFEWQDDDGDGRHERERRATFAPEGYENSIEETFWNDAGVPDARIVSTWRSAKKEHVVNQRFVDGGWQTISEFDPPPPGCGGPIEPMRVPGK